MIFNLIKRGHWPKRPEELWHLSPAYIKSSSRGQKITLFPISLSKPKIINLFISIQYGKHLGPSQAKYLLLFWKCRISSLINLYPILYNFFYWWEMRDRNIYPSSWSYPFVFLIFLSKTLPYREDFVPFPSQIRHLHLLALWIFL